MTAALQRLRAEVASDRAALLARLEELAGLDLASGGPPIAAQAAVALHHAYGATEAALTRVARSLEGEAPTGAEWYQALLHSMALDIPGVRPRVLSDDSIAPLRRLLAFRHFFRHAYAVSLDHGQLAVLRDQIVAARAPLERDLDRLDAFLASLAGALAP